MTERQNRKPLPLAEFVWSTDGKKRPTNISRTIESEIAEMAQGFCRLNYQVVPDGETSNGSQKYRALTPQEVAERSVAIAEALFSELEARGHVIFLPSFDEAPNDSGPMGFTP